MYKIQSTRAPAAWDFIKILYLAKGVSDANTQTLAPSYGHQLITLTASFLLGRLEP